MRASAPPILRSFAIHGLHGYKNMSVEFQGAATVVVAENGSGKTTLLNALNAFLSVRFARLASIEFDYIDCHFSAMDAPIRLYRNDLGPRSADSTDPISEHAERVGISEQELSEFVRTYDPAVPSHDLFGPRSGHVARQLYVHTPGDEAQLRALIMELKASLERGHTDSAKLVAQLVRSVMEPLEVIYLPTYRRVEVALMRPPGPRNNSARLRASGGIPGHSGSEQIAFGLSDVKKRLKDIGEDIERRSNNGYRILSAQMLEELLQGQLTPEKAESAPLPDLDSLTRFLSRVSRSNSTTGVVQGIGQLYENDQIDANQNTVLRYFLGRLGRVIDETRETELAVEKFAEVCNEYLRADNDGKILAYDPQSLHVIVHDLWSRREIPLDSLSSGEKQIVSMMSRLYLTSNPKVVLIDEPELSLSIDWQKRILPDLLDSGSVVQLLAITHSPFIFENELDSVAIPIKLTRDVVEHDAH
ncbi:AAA family ATPase [Luteibacter sp. Lutesp34]|uniref:AAA family ATPase n=1 Tax=Luteibacter sp. Lutesp34 TaxID=3243030 RepID=UPI0039B56E90